MLHELGHLLLGHHKVPLLGLDASKALFPQLDPAIVQQVLGRTGYTEDEEKQAELVASLIQERVSRWSREGEDVSADDAQVIGRVERVVLGRRRRDARDR